MSAEMVTILTAVIGVLFGTCAYFLKQTMDTVKAHTKQIEDANKNMSDNFAKKDEVKSDIDKLEVGMKEKTDALSKDVVSIKDKYLTKEDFYRSQADTNQKLDKIYDLILEMKGGSPHG